MGEWDSDDILNIATASNDIALQWYAMTHGQPLPQNDGITFNPLPNTRIGISSQTLVLLVLGGLALYLVTKR
jgi:hypothetical protein